MPRVSLVQVTQPTALPISLHEVKAQARVVDNEQDAVLVGYIRAATNYVEESTGLRLVTQTWAQSVDWLPVRWNGYLRMPIAPVQSITEISYLNASGVPTIMSPAVYVLRGERVMLAPEATWPALWHGLDVATITFVVGYGPDHNYVPESIRQAISMLVTYWFAQREAAAIGPDAGPVSDIPFACARFWMRIGCGLSE
jgi:uncharacterized phiE125 gp8 family phage protein